MINSITLKYLRNAEFIQFSKDSISIVHQNDPTVLSVAGEYGSFQTVAAAIEDLFKIDRSNPITAEIEALDERRDAALSGIGLFIQAHIYHFAPATAAAAKTLADHLTVFGTGIAKENYQSETAIISSIINDYHTQPALIAAIAVLGLGSWATELDTANQAFNTQYLARTQQLATISPDTIKAKRLEAANAWYTLRDTIDAYYTIKKGAQPWAKTVSELNALIDQYNTLIAGRKGGDATTPAVNNS